MSLLSRQSLPNSRMVIACCCILFMLYLVQGVGYLRSQSITADEGSFLNYAVRFIHGHPERVFPTRDNSKMPVSVINLIPRMIEQSLHPGLQKSDSGASDIMHGRYVTLACSLITLLLVFLWSRQLYGDAGALFSLFLITFCPNTLASAGLVTTDSYAQLFLLLSMYLLWRYCRHPSLRMFILFSCCVALAQLAKQSLIHLYIICPLTWLFYPLSTGDISWRRTAWRLAIFVCINVLTINAAYYFTGLNLRIGEYHFMSDAFRQVQRLLPSRLPVPFPKAFVEGLDMAKYYDQIGGGIDHVSSFGKVTILGRSTVGGSFWYYYLVSLLFKTPIATLTCIIASLIIVMRLRRWQHFVAAEWFLLTPVAYFIVYMSFFYKTQCGIRHLIFIYPLLYVLCGILARIINPFGRGLVIAAGAALVISVVSYRNNFYPYTNELVGNKTFAFQKVGAANLEYNQGQLFFNDYLHVHPHVRMAPTAADTGTFLINVNDYLDVWSRHRYDWIARIPPVGQVAYNGLLIHVEPAMLPARYQNSGRP